MSQKILEFIFEYFIMSSLRVHPQIFPNNAFQSRHFLKFRNSSPYTFLKPSRGLLSIATIIRNGVCQKNLTLKVNRVVFRNLLFQSLVTMSKITRSVWLVSIIGFFILKLSINKSLLISSHHLNMSLTCKE